MTHDFATMINEKKPFHCILFDLKSAFDKVQPQMILKKLRDLCVDDSVIELLGSYLTDRTFAVTVVDESSDVHDVSSGVLQGGSVSPMLYAIFVLDLREYLPEGVKYLLYADDMKTDHEV